MINYQKTNKKNLVVFTICKSLTLLQIRHLWWFTKHNPEKGTLSYYCRETAFFLKKKLNLSSSVDVLHEQIQAAVLGVGGLGGGALTIFKGRVVYHQAERFIQHQREMVIAHNDHFKRVAQLKNKLSNATSSKAEGYENMTPAKQEKLSQELIADNAMFYQQYRAMLNQRKAKASKGEASLTLEEHWGHFYHGQTLAMQTPLPGRAASIHLAGSSPQTRQLEAERRAAVPIDNEDLLRYITVGGNLRNKDGTLASNEDKSFDNAMEHALAEDTGTIIKPGDF